MNYYRSRKSLQAKAYASRVKAMAWGGICITWGCMGIVVAKGDAIPFSTVDSDDRPDNKATPATSISPDVGGAQISSTTTLPQVPDLPTYKTLTTRGINPSLTTQRSKLSISTVPTARVAMPTQHPRPSLSNRPDSRSLSDPVEIQLRPSSTHSLPEIRPETRPSISSQANEVIGAEATQPLVTDSQAITFYSENRPSSQEPANVTLQGGISSSAEAAISGSPAGLPPVDNQVFSGGQPSLSVQDNKDAFIPRKVEIQSFHSSSPAAAFAAQLPEIDASIAGPEETVPANSTQPGLLPINHSPENLKSSVNILWANSSESRPFLFPSHVKAETGGSALRLKDLIKRRGAAQDTI